MGQIPSTVAQDALPWARILRLSHRMRSQGPGVDFHGYLLKDFVATPGRWRRRMSDAPPTRRCACPKVRGGGRRPFFCSDGRPPDAPLCVPKSYGGRTSACAFLGRIYGPRLGAARRFSYVTSYFPFGLCFWFLVVDVGCTSSLCACVCVCVCTVGPRLPGGSGAWRYTTCRVLPCPVMCMSLHSIA